LCGVIFLISIPTVLLLTGKKPASGAAPAVMAAD
jgi:hypothetical protein